MKRKILCLTGLFLSTAVFSQEIELQKNLSLNQAIECAVENNLSIKESRIQLEQVERTYNHGWNNFLPSLNASVSVTDSSQISPVEKNNLSISAGLSANLSLSAGLGKKLKAIKENYKSGLMNYEDCIREVKSSVTKDFYSLLYKEKQLELCRKSLELYQDQYNQTKIKKANGRIPELDLLSSQVNLENAKIDLKNSEKTFNNSLLRFLNDIGYSHEKNSKILIMGSLDDCQKYEEINFSNLDLKTLVEQSPSVRVLKDSLRQNELSLTQAKMDAYCPSVSLSAKINPYEKNFLVKTNEETVSNSWSVSAGISIPLDNLIPGSDTKDSIAKIKDSTSIYKLQIEDKQKEILTEALEIIHTIEIAKDTLENCRQNVELAKKSYELAEVAYKNGTKALSDLQTVQNSYNTANVQLNNQQLSLITSVIELNNLLGIN